MDAVGFMRVNGECNITLRLATKTPRRETGRYEDLMQMDLLSAFDVAATGGSFSPTNGGHKEVLH
jgi:hypothetical protein